MTVPLFLVLSFSRKITFRKNIYRRIFNNSFVYMNTVFLFMLIMQLSF